MRVSAVLVLIALVTVGAASAQPTVRLAGAAIQETLPGGTASTGFVLENQTDRAGAFVEDFKLPEGWSPITPVGEVVQLGPHQSDVRLIAFAVPTRTPAGDYVLTYVGRRQDEPGSGTKATVTIRVRASDRITLTVLERPEAVIAGADYKVVLQLTNEGNTTRQLRMDARARPVYPMELVPAAVSLAGGASSTLTLTVHTSAKLPKAIHQGLEIRVFAPPATAAVAVQSPSVALLPASGAEVDLKHRIPGALRLAGTGEEARRGYFAELAGAGPIDEKGTAIVEYLFRTPGTQTVSSFGIIDEYRASFLSGPLGIWVGDRGYQLSPLTQTFRYGRGAEAALTRGRFDVGMYVLKSRFTELDERQSALHVGYRLTDALQIRANALRKSPSDRGPSQRVFSVETNLASLRGPAVNLELGRSRTDSGAPIEDQALRLETHGVARRDIFYHFEKIHGGPGFAGLYRDFDLSSGSVDLPVGRRVRINLNARRVENNLDRTSIPLLVDAPLDQPIPVRTVALREEAAQATMLLALSARTRASLSVKNFDRTDNLYPADFDFREATFIAGAGHTFRKVSVNGTWESGTLTDRLSQFQGHIQRRGAFVSHTPTPNQGYSLFYSDGPSPLSGTLEDRTTGGASVSSRLTPQLFTFLQVSRSIAEQQSATGFRSRRIDQASARVAYVFPSDDLFELKSRVIVPEETPAIVAVLASYTIPFGLPTGPKMSVGSLSGRVHDLATPGDPGLGGVILTAGTFSAVTNARGIFRFPPLAPGAYFVQIARGPRSVSRVSQERMPLEVRVTGGRRTKLEIAMINAARVFGRVTKVDGMAGVLVELTDGKETLRRLTSASGAFEFEDVRPGQWTLSVTSQGIPEYHRVEKPGEMFTLAAGARHESNFHVVEQARNVKIIEEGEVILRFHF